MAIPSTGVGRRSGRAADLPRHGARAVRTPSIAQVNEESAPWTAWQGWPVGVRVVVRRRLAEGGLSDVLGDLLATGPEGVHVRTRRGEVAVAAADIVIGRIVPPPPPPRPRRTA